MTELCLASLTESLCEIAQSAGTAILSVYQSSDFEVEIKADHSPLTLADLKSHQIISQQLQAHFPAIPCLSEESKKNEIEHRRGWQNYFLIDPLDGTKEFVARNDEFTVNIAYIQQGRVVAGVVYAPVLNLMYFAYQQGGAYKVSKDGSQQPIHVRKIEPNAADFELAILASGRHGYKKAQKLCRGLAPYQLLTRGSSLKMCLIAEGLADFYPRFAPTCEWDTAAAQIIVEQAGGQMVDLDFKPLQYNQRETLLNPYFLTLGDASYPWQQKLSQAGLNEIRDQSNS